MADKVSLILLLCITTLQLSNCKLFESKLTFDDPVETSNSMESSTQDELTTLLKANNKLMTEMLQKHDQMLQKHDQMLEGLMNQQQMQNEVMNGLVGLLQKYDDGQVLYKESAAPIPSETHSSMDPPAEDDITYRDCDEYWKAGINKTDIYKINPPVTCTSKETFQVVCDMDTQCNGWTVIQRRFDGSENFNRGWNDYVNGFGKMPGDYWLGLEKIHRLTKWSGDYRLRIELEDYNGNTTYVEYYPFKVYDKSTYYKLYYGSYYGIGGHALQYNNQMAFSTYDNSHDKSTQYNCAKLYKGGWWFSSCGEQSNLHGIYEKSSTPAPTIDAMRWDLWQGSSPLVALKKVEMKIKRPW